MYFKINVFFVTSDCLICKPVFHICIQDHVKILEVNRGREWKNVEATWLLPQWADHFLKGKYLCFGCMCVRVFLCAWKKEVVK